jgi:gluconokinase
MPDPTIVIVMGVSGSGKSHLANQLARVTGWAYAEGDDYHSTANKAKMHAGIPLTDEDRAPWLDALHQILLGWQRSGQSGILTCSALKATYREHLAAGLPDLRFVWLDPPKSVLADRLSHRVGHYMSPALLDSQLSTLEAPAADGKTLHLDGAAGVDDEVAKVQAFLKA